MNAYELADFIDKYCVDNTSKEAAKMLRQQADRIAELERIERRLREQIEETKTRSKYYGWQITGLR